MMPFDDGVERLKAFGSQAAGQILVLVLLKRYRYEVTGLDPRELEEGWVDTYSIEWHRLARVALEDDVEMIDATREQLWRMAKSIAKGIEKRHAEHGKREGADHYPDAWEGMLRLALHGAGKRKPIVQEAETSLPPSNPRLSALAAVDFVAQQLGCEEAEVLRRVRRTRATIRAADEPAILALLKDHLEARRAAGGNEG
jgi:hypothetical protein